MKTQFVIACNDSIKYVMPPGCTEQQIETARLQVENQALKHYAGGPGIEPYVRILEVPVWQGNTSSINIPEERVLTDEYLLDMLCLVLEELPDISKLTDEQKLQAFEWAAIEHLVASDNDDLERLPKPDFI